MRLGLKILFDPSLFEIGQFPEKILQKARAASKSEASFAHSRNKNQLAALSFQGNLLNSK
jgi:hypothetical protein